VITVSEPYLREIQTPEGGFGLHSVIQECAAKCFGILNGADYSVWNPASDPLLPAHYDVSDLAGKADCRKALLKAVNLAPSPTGPVFGMVTRFSEQKGLDILLPILDRLLSDDIRLVVLGEGDPALEAGMRGHLLKHRDRLAFRQEFDAEMAHLIEAGSDVGIIPSRFEPCGLTAIYSLKYGTLPVARAVGGLSQIIADYDPMSDAGWGFLFHRHTSEALWDAMKRARAIFLQQEAWKRLVVRAMSQDFSWKNAAASHTRIYRSLVPEPPAPEKVAQTGGARSV